MNVYTLVGITLSLFTTCVGVKVGSTKKTASYAISGTVQQQFPYCGGARPTQEMLAKAATPIAYPNKTFYVRAGKANSATGKIVTRFSTDKEGLYTVSLSPGIYSIIVEEQLKAIDAKAYATTNQRVDEKCLVDWWTKPYYLLEVKEQPINGLNFTFVHRCFLTNDIPCITYIGPMPH